MQVTDMPIGQLVEKPRQSTQAVKNSRAQRSARTHQGSQEMKETDRESEPCGHDDGKLSRIIVTFKSTPEVKR